MDLRDDQRGRDERRGFCALIAASEDGKGEENDGKLALHGSVATLSTE
jgi:hypothetical protein